MSSARLAALHVALRYSAPAARPAIRALILESECGFAAGSPPTEVPERAAVADPEPKPREAAAAEPADDRAGSSSETNARQSHPAAGGRSGARGEDDGQTLASAAGAGGSPASTKLCRQCGKPFVPYNSRQLLCGNECRRARQIEHNANYAATHQRRVRRPIAPPAANADPEPKKRQAPLRPAWQLGWDPSVVIGPARPAPLRRHPSGQPMLFRDDLAAIGDHGSPGHPLSLALGQARASVLADLR